MLRLGLLLAGNGALDGSDPLQVSAWRIAAAQRNHFLLPTAPDVAQRDVVGPRGVVPDARRDVLAESMRLVSGAVERTEELRADEIDALVVPGGLGTVKTLCSAAVEEPVVVLAAPGRLARDVLDRGGVVAAVDEACVWLGWALRDGGLALASDGRTISDQDLRTAGHVPTSTGEIVRDPARRVLTQWSAGTVDPATRLAATVELLERIEAELASRSGA